MLDIVRGAISESGIDPQDVDIELTESTIVQDDALTVSKLPDYLDGASLSAVSIALAHRLRLNVVAEGVEWAGQAIIFIQRGCDEDQGYLFGRASPPEGFKDRMWTRPALIAAEVTGAFRDL